MTGWNLPPGCSVRDIERAFGEETPCAVCGLWSEDCVCPECPQCGTLGDPYCYEHHGLVRTFEQVWLHARMEQAQIEEAAIVNGLRNPEEEWDRMICHDCDGTGHDECGWPCDRCDGCGVTRSRARGGWQ